MIFITGFFFYLFAASRNLTAYLLKMYKSKLQVLVGLCFVTQWSIAMPGPGGGGPPGPPGGGGPPCWAPPCIPIDNGLVFLIIAGCLLAVYKLTKLRDVQRGE